MCPLCPFGPIETKMTDDEIFLRRFEDATLPFDQWHHREHIKVAYLYLSRYPLEQALEKMRDGLRAYNTAHRVPDELTRGYHETITQAWMRLVNIMLSEYGQAETADRFCEQHPQLLQYKVLRFFYSQDLLMSPRAKVEFIQPDLAPFPQKRRVESGE